MGKYKDPEYQKNYYRQRSAKLKARAASRYRENRASQLEWHRTNARRAKLQQVLRDYGLTARAYTRMLEIQQHRCLVCGDRHYGQLVVDHDHMTGAVRGALCRNCNAAIGQLQDSPEVVRRALAYLEVQHHPS